MIVVSDTSPLIYLARLQRLDLLRVLYGRIVVPPSVHRELASGASWEVALDAIGDWIEVIAPANLLRVQSLRETLDAGEAEGIALAEELGADLLLIDERSGREAAKRGGLRAYGVLGVLLEAKRSGAISLIGPELVRLRRETTFRASSAAFDDALRLAGEPVALSP